MYEDSILDSTKKVLGIDSECKEFDQEIIMFINSTFSTLYQIGVGSKKGEGIYDNLATWIEFFSDTPDLINLICSYTYGKVRMLFDPPTNSFVLDSLNKQVQELEWRIQIQAEGGFDEQ